MKITKFAQSCILIETKGKRILIDPGNINYDPKMLENEWKNIDIILITHWHNDHCHEEAILSIISNNKSKLYATNEVKKKHPSLNPIIIKEGDKFSINSINIEVVKAVHGYIPSFKQRNAMVYENIGYIVDDGKNKAYHVSDSICFENEYTCDIIFVPVSNHGLTMGPWEAALYAKEAGAKIAIPIHGDNPTHLVNYEEVEKEFKANSMNLKIMKIGEQIEV